MQLASPIFGMIAGAGEALLQSRALTLRLRKRQEWLDLPVSISSILTRN
jgi:hypothetical protein